MPDRLVIQVTRNPYRVSISQLDDNDAGHGYRIAGPKFDGITGEVVLSRTLDEDDAAEIRNYLDRAFPRRLPADQINADPYEAGYSDGASSLVADIRLGFDPDDGAQSMDELLDFFRAFTADPELEWPATRRLPADPPDGRTGVHVHAIGTREFR